MSAGAEILRQTERALTLVRLLVVAGAITGVGLVVAGLVLSSWIAVLGGVFLGLGVGYLHLTYLASARPERRVRQQRGGGPAIDVGLRPQLPLSLLCALTGVVLLLGWFAWSTDARSLQLGGWLLAVAALLPVPDVVRALLAPDRGLLVSTRGLRLRGWSLDAEIDWDELASTELDTRGPNRITIWFVTRGEAAAPRVRMHRRIAWLEPRPGSDRFGVPSIALDAPWHLMAFVDVMAGLPADLRERYLADEGLHMLSGRSPRRL